METHDIIWDEDPCIFIFKDEIPGKMKMHVKNLDLYDWVRIDATYPKQMAVKQELYRSNMDDIFISRVNNPTTDHCKKEFYELLTDHVLERFPDIFEKQGDHILNRVTGELIPIDPDDDEEEDVMLRAGRLTQDDWIIMEYEENQLGYVLTAGNLCFPSDWSLKEKFNKPMQMIHKPVKPYLRHLKDKVDSLFLRLKAENPLWRANWGIYSSLDDTFDLFSHPNKKLHTQGGSRIPFKGEETGRKLFLRCEYHTLRKLPKTGCIVFGIRTYMRYLSDMKNQPKEDIQSLIDAIEDLDDEYSTYKGGDVWKVAALKYLKMILNEKSESNLFSRNCISSRTILMSGVFAVGAITALKTFKKYFYT